MATRDIYEDGFDEDILNETTTPCPECSGHVSTNSQETICEDCGLVLDEHRTDYGPEWYGDEDETCIRGRANAFTYFRHSIIWLKYICCEIQVSHTLRL
ncbi:hypothetical protein BG842_09685 [Haladaptatus sp. W1]|uniref:TFIIB-type zinc ribbon-containing protein n=1 Tax=Haladaptatus sp. W1 TaxID=1897478 RepID=UPI000849A837|nr:TFIIB-type zinc ribbon-containing protein [Haladaptatus sp. W1]ODR83380.1 hypothetical protein BG842_09685 [Haladaptatus sp. W1]